jgi:propanol-preferring alcohol dehydrogenase
MRAIRLISPNAPLVEVDLPEPSPGPDEVKIAIAACGICHSDAHYRAGFGGVGMPRTPGHEIAGVISEVGSGVSDVAAGDRVAVHYLLSCGTCSRCSRSGEQFCEEGRMIGKHADGGYAESIVVPAANAIPVPPSVPLEVAAVMMCSTATAYHALRVGRLKPRESVAILGFGGLGTSALALSLALEAEPVAAVDVVPEKLDAARTFGAVPIDAGAGNVTGDLLVATGGHGIDLAVDFTGRPELCLAALRALAPGGRLVVVALSEAPLSVNPYRDVLASERSIVGCSDHTRGELVELLALAANGRLDVSHAISRRVPFEAEAVNGVLDELERGTGTLRSVMVRG